MRDCAFAFVEDLLEADGAGRVEPDGDLGNILADCGILGDQFELVSGDAVDRFCAEILDVHLSCRSCAAGAEAEHEIALVLPGLGVGFGVALFAGVGNTKDAAGKDVRFRGGPIVVVAAKCAAIWKCVPLR